jgi:hypothetical protein
MHGVAILSINPPPAFHRLQQFGEFRDLGRVPLATLVIMPPRKATMVA